MARITVEDCLGEIGNRFALVLLVSKRAKQLLKGTETIVKSRGNKYIVNALREVAASKVRFDIDLSQGTPEEQVERDFNRK